MGRPGGWLAAVRRWIGGDAARPDLVVIATASGESLVELWRSRLAAEGIPAMIELPAGAGLYGGLYALRVRRRDAGRAAATLGLDAPDLDPPPKG